MAWDVFGNEEKMGENIVIVGGGSVGCELGISLAEKGKKVTILEMGHFFAPKSEIAERMSLEEHMIKHAIQIHVDTTCTEITPEGVSAAGRRMCRREAGPSFAGLFCARAAESSIEREF